MHAGYLSLRAHARYHSVDDSVKPANRLTSSTPAYGRIVQAAAFRRTGELVCCRLQLNAWARRVAAALFERLSLSVLLQHLFRFISVTPFTPVACSVLYIVTGYVQRRMIVSEQQVDCINSILSCKRDSASNSFRLAAFTDVYSSS